MDYQSGALVGRKVFGDVGVKLLHKCDTATARQE
jgi:hypothetical protein